MAKPLFNKAFAVGVLVAVAFTAFLVAYTFFRKGGFSQRDSYAVHAYFADATGLTWKSRVQIAGIQVGEVEHIVLEGQRARLQLRIKNEIDLRADACISKRFPSALLPDALLDAVPGTPKAPSLREAPEAEREVKCVNEAAGVAKLLDSLQKISTDISAVTGELADTVKGERGSIRQIMENLARVSANLDRTVAENADKVGRILENTESFTGTVAEVAGKDKERYRAIARNVEEASMRLNDVLAGLQDIVGTGSSGKDLRESVTSARSALEKVNRSLEDVQKTTAMLAEGRGVAGKLIADERLGEKVGGALEGVSSYVDRLVKLQLQVELRSEWLLSQSGAKTYLGLRLLPRPDKYYIFELVNDPRGVSSRRVEVVTTQVGANPPETTTITTQTYDERLRFSLEFAKRYGPMTFRIGVIESSGGVGSDLHLLDDALKVSVNFYQFSRPQVSLARAKFWADYRFLRYFYLTAGADDVFNAWRSGRFPGGPRFVVGRDVFFGGGITFTDDDLKTLFFVGGSSVGSVR